MTRFDDLPPEIQDAMCTPFHNILQPLADPQNPTSAIGGLYLGSLSAVVDPSVDDLRTLHITHIVQVFDVPWLVLTEEDGFTCFCVNIQDIPSQKLDTPLLERVCAHIEDVRKAGNNVLVHCQQGVSRSASIVIAYLIRSQGMTYDEAFKFVKSKRACVKPNPGFVGCLRAWEETCKASQRDGETVDRAGGQQEGEC